MNNNKKKTGKKSFFFDDYTESETINKKENRLPKIKYDKSVVVQLNEEIDTELV